MPPDESPKYFDAELTEKGTDQARQVGEVLLQQGRQIQIALVSPLTRTLCVPLTWRADSDRFPPLFV